jgi:hypothetical protein
MFFSSQQRSHNIMRQTSSISINAFFVIVLASLVGCAGVNAGERRLGATGTSGDPLPPGTEFSTVEAAAVAALAYVRETSTRSESERLRVGSIVETENGYTWTEGDHSGSHTRANWRPKARIALTDAHAAAYVVHPRTGDRQTDRANERVTRSERRLVDEVDPQHRPMFLLTPTGRIVAYNHGAPVVEIADLRRNRRDARRGVVSADKSPTVELAAGSR